MKRKKLTTVSASSITTFLDCPRRWFIKYVLGERPDPSPAMLHGTEVHDDIEAYLTGEQPAPQSVEAAEAKSKGYIPDPGEVRKKFVEYDASDLNLRIEGLKFLGYLDLVEPDFGDLWRITDWKTRSRFDYAPKGDELLDDIQAGLYAWASMRLSGHDRIIFRHVNMLRVDGKRGRKSPRSMESSCIFERETVETWMQEDIVRIVRAMKSCAVKEYTKHVKQNRSNCYKYGPCEYMSPISALHGQTCHDIKYQPVKQNQRKKESKMSMMDLIKKKKSKKKAVEEAPKKAEAEEQSGAAEETPKKAAPAQEAEPGDALTQAKQDFIDGKNSFDLADYDLSHMDKREFILWRKKRLEEATQAQRENDTPPVNPPDAATDDEPVDLEDQKTDDYDFTDVDGVGAKTAENIREFIAEKGITDLVEMLDMNLRKIGGIGKKSEDALKETIKRERNWAPDDHDPEQEDQGEDQPEDQRALLDAAKKSALDGEPFDEVLDRMAGHTKQAFENWAKGKTFDSDGTGKDQGFTEPKKPADPQLPASAPSILYIDCYPTKGPRPVDLGDLLRPLKEALKEERGEYYWNVEGYGKGRKWLTSAALEEPAFLIDAQAVVARSGDQGMDHLLPEIRQYFDYVIEG